MDTHNRGRDYSRILQKGEKNAVSAEKLTEMLGLHDTRALQRDIAASRAAGQIILSSATGGYYLPGNRQEIQRFVNTCERRAKSTFAALRSARQALKETEGQISMDEAGKPTSENVSF